MPRSEADKKAEERAHAELALRTLEIAGTVEDGDPPDFRPDMRIVFPGGRVVGLEHTLAVVEGIAAGSMPTVWLEGELRAALKASDLRVGVSVRIPQTLGMQLANREVRQREIEVVMDMVREGATHGGTVAFEELRDIVAADGTVCWRDPKRDSKKRTYLDLKDGLVAVTAVTVAPSETPFVMRSLPGDVHRHALIQTAIDDKAGKIDAYRMKHSEVWLLVVGSATLGGSLDISAAEGEFTSPFDKTIFLELFEEKCAVLRTKRPTT